MANGLVAIRRLNGIQMSLERALASVQRELDHRKEDEDYKPTYLHELTQLRSQAESLEDALSSKLNFG
jgi:hypothetical protein